VEELAVATAMQGLFRALQACETAGGDTNKAFTAAIPPEVLDEMKRQMPILAFIGL
jgi:hypothetical protein